MDRSTYVSIIRKIDEEARWAAKMAKGAKNSQAWDEYNGLMKARGIIDSVLIAKASGEPPLPTYRMDELPHYDELGTDEWKQSIREKYPNRWRLEVHDQMGLHWNLNDEDPPNTLGFRTVLVCGDDDHDEIEAKAEEVYMWMMKEHGRVDYLEFYKAMNA